jgi:membrane protease YdiL (CAAX protease family)
MPLFQCPKCGKQVVIPRAGCERVLGALPSPGLDAEQNPVYTPQCPDCTPLKVEAVEGDLPANAKHPLPFLKTRKGGVLHIIGVLVPSALLLQAGHLLLLGLLLSVAVAWIGMRLQGISWDELGLKRPQKPRAVFVTSLVATLGLIPASYFLRQVVTAAFARQPSLDTFRGIEGNVTALLIGLVVVWTCAAFGEELLFRGFLMNAFHRLLNGPRLRERSSWGVSLLVTSILVGLGHAYQGITGMVVTGVIGLCLGMLYLCNGRNLWPSILTHGFYDTAAFVLLFLGLRPE